MVLEELDVEEEVDSEEDEDTDFLPKFHVVLLNDDDHTVEYVIEVMNMVFGYGFKKGLEIAMDTHKEGKCIVWSGHKELAELKSQQINNAGGDRYTGCTVGMKSVVEPS